MFHGASKSNGFFSHSQCYSLKCSHKPRQSLQHVLKMAANTHCCTSVLLQKCKIRIHYSRRPVPTDVQCSKKNLRTTFRKTGELLLKKMNSDTMEANLGLMLINFRTWLHLKMTSSFCLNSGGKKKVSPILDKRNITTGQYLPVKSIKRRHHSGFPLTLAQSLA